MSFLGGCRRFLLLHKTHAVTTALLHGMNGCSVLTTHHNHAHAENLTARTPTTTVMAVMAQLGLIQESINATAHVGRQHQTMQPGSMRIKEKAEEVDAMLKGMGQAWNGQQCRE